jgi:hypothetical protein
MTNDNLNPQHYEDLQKSGLSDDTIEKAGIKSVSPDHVNERVGFNVHGVSSAYEIPYPGCDGYSRYRCFYRDGETGPKYFLRQNTAPRLYIPPAQVTNLPENTEVYITWGEKKVLKATLEGLICIGIGGVRGWDNGNGSLIPDFDLIDLKNCVIHLVPDNDWRSTSLDGNSSDIEQSVNQLAVVLCDRNVSVKIVLLPEGPEKGLDDYLSSHSADDFIWLPVEFVHRTDTRVRVEPFIEELNQNHAVINVSGGFYILEETIDPTFGYRKIQFSSPTDFKNFYAYRFVDWPHPKNENKMVKTCIADAWRLSRQRREYKGIVFEPGKDVPRYYNLWQGFSVEPIEGDWSLMREHIKKIICQGNEDLFRWVMAWMARIVQEPGNDRPGTCIVLLGGPGVGKGILAREFGALFVAHFLHLNSISHVTSQFNAHLANKLLVFCDEALWDGDKKAEGVMKAIITEPTFPLQYKYKDIFQVKNYANLIIASNSSWVVPANENERRFCVLDVSPERAKDTRYFNAIVNQMMHGGREAMLYDLQKLDIAGINLRIIPKTTALTGQVLHGLDGVAKFWLHCLTHPESLPRERMGGQPYVGKTILYNLYCKFYEKKKSKTPILRDSAFGRELRKYCPGIQDGRASTDEKGNRPMLYILPPLNECQSQFEKAIGMTGVFDP